MAKSGNRQNAARVGHRQKWESGAEAADTFRVLLNVLVAGSNWTAMSADQPAVERGCDAVARSSGHT